MSTIQKFFSLLVEYDYLVLPLLFLAVWIFGFANWCHNVYRKQNRQFKRCARKMVCDRNILGMHLAGLPQEYRRQWRSCVNARVERPSQVFEFVPRRNKIIFLHLFVAAAAVTSCYLAIFIQKGHNTGYVLFQGVFWLSFAFCLVLEQIIFAHKQKTARQIFGKFVATLNKVWAEEQKDADERQIYRKLKALRHPAGEKELQLASQLLEKAEPRTVEQQKEINKTLNSLLQSYARNAALADI